MVIFMKKTLSAVIALAMTVSSGINGIALAENDLTVNSYYADSNGVYFTMQSGISGDVTAEIDGNTASVSADGTRLTVIPSEKISRDTEHTVTINGVSKKFKLNTLFEDDFENDITGWMVDDVDDAKENYGEELTHENGKLKVTQDASKNAAYKVYYGGDDTLTRQEMLNWSDYSVDYDIRMADADGSKADNYRLFTEMLSTTTGIGNSTVSDGYTFMSRRGASGGYLTGILSGSKRGDLNVWSTVDLDYSSDGYVKYTSEDPSFDSLTTTIYGSEQRMAVNGVPFLKTNMNSADKKGAFTFDISGSVSSALIDNIAVYKFEDLSEELTVTSYYADSRGIYFTVNKEAGDISAEVDGAAAAVSTDGKRVTVIPSEKLSADTLHTVVINGTITRKFVLNTLFEDDFENDITGWKVDDVDKAKENYGEELTHENGKLKITQDASKNAAYKVYYGGDDTLTRQEMLNWSDYSIDYDIQMIGADGLKADNYRLFTEMLSTTTGIGNSTVSDGYTFMSRRGASGGYLTGILSGSKRGDLNVWSVVDLDYSSDGYVKYTSENPSLDSLTTTIYGSEQRMAVNGVPFLKTNMNSADKKGAFTFDISGSASSALIDNVVVYKFEDLSAEAQITEFFADKDGMYFTADSRVIGAEITLDGADMNVVYSKDGKSLSVKPDGGISFGDIHTVTLNGKTYMFRLNEILSDDFTNDADGWKFFEDGETFTEKSVSDTNYSKISHDSNGYLVLDGKGSNKGIYRMYYDGADVSFEDLQKLKNYTVDIDLANADSNFRMMIDLRNNERGHLYNKDDSTGEVTGTASGGYTYLMRKWTATSPNCWFAGIYRNGYNLSGWNLSNTANPSVDKQAGLGTALRIENDLCGKTAFGNIKAHAYGNTQKMEVNGNTVLTESLTTAERGAFEISAPDSANPILIDKISVYSFEELRTGIEIEALTKTDNSLTASIKLETLEPVSGTLICAVYDSNGKLLGVKTDDSSKTSLTIDGDMSKAAKVKAMLWQSMENITPICSSAVKTVNN